MKKLSILGKFLKYGFVLILLLGVVKIIATVIYGYRKVDPTYGGAYFYNWSSVYIDDKLPKTFYMPNKLLEQRKNEDFKRFVEMVQTKGRKEESIYPYYAYGLPDTQVLTAAKTWTIFNTKEKMNLEFQFLDMRGRFISMMHDVKYDAKGPYFVDASKKDEKKKVASTMGKPICKKAYFKKLDGSAVSSFFSDSANSAVVNGEDFQTIVKKIMAKTKNYGVEYPEGKAKMTAEFETDVMKVVNTTFSGLGITVDMVNAFFHRVSTLLPTAMDVHIINRIKLYFLYSNSYLTMKGVSNKEYEKQRIIYEELNEKEKKGEGLDDEKKRKMKNADSRMHAIRMGAICSKASMLFGSILGNRGPILEKDDRNWFAWLGSPSVATIKKMKKTEKGDLTIFDNQIRSHHGISS